MKEIEKERQMIREIAIKTAQKIIQPRAAEIDEIWEFPRDLMETIGKQGYLSILLPEEYGGMNGDITTFCLLIEEIAKVSGSSSLLLLAQEVGTLPVWLGDIEAARALVYQAATRVDAGLEGAEKLSTMAKLYASNAAMKVTTDAVQIPGGYGYMKDYPVERMMRDAKVTQTLEGSNQVRRLVVANHLFRD